MNKLYYKLMDFHVMSLQTLQPGSMTTLAQLYQHCTASLLNIVYIFKILLITYEALNDLAPQ